MKKLRVALETQFAYGTPTGLGVYAGQLHAALRRRSDLEVVEICDPGLDVWRFNRRVYWDQVLAPRLVRRAHADVAHFTGGTLPAHAPHPSLLTLHDVAWLHHAVPARLYSRWYFGALQRRWVLQADRIATDTHAGREDLLQNLKADPAKVAVTGAGVEEIYFALPRQVADPPYLLCVGTVEERKDLATALRLLPKHPDLHLISVGPLTPYAETVDRLAAELGVSKRFIMSGYVKDSSLHALYAGAVALVFPSWYEGFGLPPLQALAARVPVVASDIPVMREVLGDCAWYATPHDDKAFADALAQVRAGGSDVAMRAESGRMWARQFSWPAVAERTVRLYKSIA